MVTTVTLTAGSMVPGVLATVGVAAVVTLIASLILKEVVGGAGNRFKPFQRHLDVVILPLLFVFTVIVATKVAEVLA